MYLNYKLAQDSDEICAPTIIPTPLCRLLELTKCSHSISYNMPACPTEEAYVTTMTISVLMDKEGTQPRMGWQLFSCLKVVLQVLGDVGIQQ